jgi:E3 ubiquitin-protein ligase UBR4
MNTRPQTDLTSALLAQLKAPLDYKVKYDAAEAMSSLDDDDHNFTTKNINRLVSLEAGDTLINICLGLPQLSKYIEQWENATNGEDANIPVLTSEEANKGQTFSVLLEDIDIVWKALSLPILEPLTPERLHKLGKIVMGCLVASVSVASTPITSDDMEAIAVEIVEKSLELFNTILGTIRQSTRAGGHILQNYITMGAWVLTSGLLVQLASASSSTAEIASSKPKMTMSDLMSHGLNLNKVQQSFNVLSVALASEALTLTSLLLEDLTSEVGSEAEEYATLDLFQTFTASQRVALVLNSVPLIPLLFNVAVVSFRKGLVKSEAGNQNDLASGGESQQKEDEEVNIEDDDDDSEPLLGRWLEETLSLFPPASAEDNKKAKNKSNKSETTSSLAKSGEPSGFYISLASHIFIFMNKHMLTTVESSSFLTRYIRNGLAEPQMIVLASMVHDLDDVQNDDSNYPEFTNALSTFNHNILALGLLTSKLQNSLLTQLGVSPWQEEGSWPLQIQPRTLAILAHVLLLRQSADQDLTSARPTTNTYISLWEKVLSSLTDAIIEEEDEDNDNYEDLNVEHVQLLLFLFHALALMQKKQLLLTTANCIIKVSKVSKTTQRQIMHTSKLVMLLEYIMKNLYEPPKSLMDDVQQNIFRKQNNNDDSLKYHNFPEIEANLRPMCQRPSPRFYNLFEAPQSTEFSQEVPKLDGLALSFILGTSESLKYAQLYQALIDNLSIVQVPMIEDKKIAYLASIQYCFTLTMRTLQSLPPSVEFVESLSGAPYLNENGEADTCSLLHSLILCHRMNDKQFATWMKDSLVKQGQTTAKAESLLKNVASAVSTFSYDIRMLKQLLRSLHDIVAKRGRLVPKEKMASFFDLIVIDATVAKLHLCLDKARTTSEVNLKVYIEAAAEVVLPLVEAFAVMGKSAIVHSIKTDMDEETQQTLLQFLSISGTRCQETASLAMTLEENCLPVLRMALSSWHDCSLAGFATLEETRRTSNMAPEVFLFSRIHCHVASLSMMGCQQNLISLKQSLYSCARFAKDLFLWCPDQGVTHVQNDIVYCLFPLIMDSCTEVLSNLMCLVLERQIGTHESDEFAAKVFRHVLNNTFGTLVKPLNREFFDERILIEIVQYMEDMLDKSIGRATLDQFFCESPQNDLVQLLLSMSWPDLSPEYPFRVLKFFNKLFVMYDKNPHDEATERLCGSLSKLADIPQSQLESWLSHVVKGW